MYGFQGNDNRINLEYPGEDGFSIQDLITSTTERKFFPHKKTELN